MDNPKISILIPLYNRKHYITQCVDSALNQTFKDYEIIIRDNCSTDGGFEFVAEKYAKEISTGKIRLYKNEENLGEFGSTHRMFKDSGSKYVIILHADDMYIPQSLETLYTTAEKFNADVVHSIQFLNSPRDGVINENTKFQLIRPERQFINEPQVMPNDPAWRFQEIINASGFYGDTQYSFFRRDFILSNDLLYDGFGSGSKSTKAFLLSWLMLAKVYVKTPVVHYIRRDAPDSGSNTKELNLKNVEEFIDQMMERTRYLEKYVIPNIRFLNDNKEIVRYHLNAKTFNVMGNFLIKIRNFYKNGVTPELNRVVENTFKKYFGEDAYYPAFLFHWTHSVPYYNPNIERLVNPPATPPPSR